MTSSDQPGSGISGEERLRSLLQVSRKLGSIRDPEELVRALAREIRGLLSFDYLSLFLVDALGGGPSWHILDVDHQAFLTPSTAIPIEQTVESRVFDHQAIVTFPPRRGEPPFPGLEAIAGRRGIASLCALPLATVNRRLGTMIVASRREEAYPEDEMGFLALVADQVALAIDDAANFEGLRKAQSELRRSNELLRLVHDVGSRILSSLDLQELLRSISSSVRTVLKCDAASVILVEPGGEDARVFALDFPDSRGFAREGHLIPLEGSALGEILRSGRPRDYSAVSVSDAQMPLVHAEGITSGWAFPLASRGRSVGVFTAARRGPEAFGADEVELIGQVAGQIATALDNALAYREIAELRDRLAEEKLYLEDEIRTELSFDEIIGRSAALRRVLKQVETVATTDSTVLIHGETGSGKELIARAIHERSARSARTFVKLNCAAIPTGLLESELFGHQRGAFTGAIADRVGRFELAQRGTMFLDEIGEVPLELQPKLLRVLQEREFERLGSSKTLRTDARLLAATNRDLASMVESGAFRADLFYRLNVFPIHVPALRERPEDIPLLVRHFVQQLGRKMKKRVETIPAETMATLARYDWPGNIRELQNLVERAMILTSGPVLQVPLDDRDGRPASGGLGPRPRTLQEAERGHILSALEETKWVLGGEKGAAARLGMNRSTLQFRMKKLGISRPTS